MIAPQEAGREFLGNAQHIVEYQYLSIHFTTGTNPNGGDGDLTSEAGGGADDDRGSGSEAESG